MPKLKLTKRAIDALAPEASDRTYWDSEIAGFGLLVTPKDGRIYILKYRAGGRQRWFKIGKHGAPWTPDSARKEALRLLGEVAAGRDPTESRAIGRTAPTFAEVGELYFARGVAHKKASTLRSDCSRWRLHLLPVLGQTRGRHHTRRRRGSAECGQGGPHGRRQAGEAAAGHSCQGRRGCRRLVRRARGLHPRVCGPHRRGQSGARRQEAKAAPDAAVSFLQ